MTISFGKKHNFFCLLIITDINETDIWLQFDR
jgi:hypothetical protein